MVVILKQGTSKDEIVKITKNIEKLIQIIL